MLTGSRVRVPVPGRRGPPVLAPLETRRMNRHGLDLDTDDLMVSRKVSLWNVGRPPHR